MENTHDSGLRFQMWAQRNAVAIEVYENGKWSEELYDSKEAIGRHVAEGCGSLEHDNSPAYKLEVHT